MANENKNEQMASVESRLKSLYQLQTILRYRIARVETDSCNLAGELRTNGIVGLHSLYVAKHIALLDLITYLHGGVRRILNHIELTLQRRKHLFTLSGRRSSSWSHRSSSRRGSRYSCQSISLDRYDF